MENTNANATTNYIMGGVGYLALLAAIVEQARADARKGDADAEKGIAEWAEIFEEDANFNLYEQTERLPRGHRTGVPLTLRRQ